MNMDEGECEGRWGVIGMSNSAAQRSAARLVSILTVQRSAAQRSATQRSAQMSIRLKPTSSYGDSS